VKWSVFADASKFCRSLSAHMAFIEQFTQRRCFCSFLLELPRRDSNSAREGLWLALVCCGTGAIAGILGWYLVIHPVLFRKPK
jgi:hypothetical protein